MAENSKIEWTHHTFNPWRGCTKVSAGCANCYAETLSHRNPGTLGIWGPSGTRVVAAESAWKEPLKWDRKARDAGERHRVFCASLADIFEDWQGIMEVGEKWPDLTVNGITMNDVRRRLFSLIAATPNLDWLLLTKRPENIHKMLGQVAEVAEHYEALKLAKSWQENVWIGTSVEDQATADERIPHLLKVPAKVRFLSIEPLLGPVDLCRIGKTTRGNDIDARLGTITTYQYKPRNDSECGIGVSTICYPPETGKIHWVIVGGESGYGARPCNVAWIRSIVKQCRAAGVPVFVKQDSGPKSGMQGRIPADIWQNKDFPHGN